MHLLRKKECSLDQFKASFRVPTDIGSSESEDSPSGHGEQVLTLAIALEVAQMLPMVSEPIHLNGQAGISKANVDSKLATLDGTGQFSLGVRPARTYRIP